jgi:hypothetical protein
MKRCLGVVAIAAGLVLVAAAARADSWVTPFRGHISFGYAKLFIPDAPAGSLSFSGGIDHPISKTVRAGLDVDFSLLGTNTVDRGSLVADVDYSTIEILAMFHWQPSWPGPLGRLSVGGGVMGARSTVNSSGAAEFQDLAVSQAAPAVAAEATLISRSSSPVKVGLETGVHTGFVTDQTWTVWDIRLAIHY